MSDRAVFIGRGLAHRMKADVEWGDRVRGRELGGNHQLQTAGEAEFFDCVYTSDIAVAADVDSPETGTAKLKFQLYNSGDGTEDSYYDDDELDDIDVINRNPYFAAFDGDIGRLVLIDSEFRPVVMIPEYIGKSDTAISKGSTGTVSIYTGDTDGTETDSGNDVTAYNRWGDIGADKWVIVKPYNGTWVARLAECG